MSAAGRCRRRRTSRSTPRAGRAPIPDLLQNDDIGRSPLTRRTISSRYDSHPGGHEWPWKRFQLRISTGAYCTTAVRVVLADPAAFTPQYDHELAAALARAGAEVELVTRHVSASARPRTGRIRPREIFYPLSTRLFRRSRLRLPLKALEHPPRDGTARREQARRAPRAMAARPAARTVAAAPLRGPSVFTAHDLLPANGRPRGSLAPLARPLRPCRRAQRARGRDAGRPRSRRRPAARDLSPCVPQRSPASR